MECDWILLVALMYEWCLRVRTSLWSTLFLPSGKRGGGVAGSFTPRGLAILFSVPLQIAAFFGLRPVGRPVPVAPTPGVIPGVG